jgi:hypothetical protein
MQSYQYALLLSVLAVAPGLAQAPSSSPCKMVPAVRELLNALLTRMFHQQSAAARDRAASTALRLAQGAPPVLDVLPSTPPVGSRRAPCICSPLIAPRCDHGETSGLIVP